MVVGQLSIFHKSAMTILNVNKMFLLFTMLNNTHQCYRTRTKRQLNPLAKRYVYKKVGPK